MQGFHWKIFKYPLSNSIKKWTSCRFYQKKKKIFYKMNMGLWGECFLGRRGLQKFIQQKRGLYWKDYREKSKKKINVNDDYFVKRKKKQKMMWEKCRKNTNEKRMASNQKRKREKMCRCGRLYQRMWWWYVKVKGHPDHLSIWDEFINCTSSLQFEVFNCFEPFLFRYMAFVRDFCPVFGSGGGKEKKRKREWDYWFIFLLMRGGLNGE